MPTLEGFTKLYLKNTLQTHYRGHTKYNAYIKYNLNTIDQKFFSLDAKKYYFWFL